MYSVRSLRHGEGKELVRGPRAAHWWAGQPIATLGALNPSGLQRPVQPARPRLLHRVTGTWGPQSAGSGGRLPLGGTALGQVIALAEPALISNTGIVTEATSQLEDYMC